MISFMSIIIIGIVYERKNRILFVCRCVFNESNDISCGGANHKNNSNNLLTRQTEYMP